SLITVCLTFSLVTAMRDKRVVGIVLFPIDMPAVIRMVSPFAHATAVSSADWPMANGVTLLSAQSPNTRESRPFPRPKTPPAFVCYRRFSFRRGLGGAGTEVLGSSADLDSFGADMLC